MVGQLETFVAPCVGAWIEITSLRLLMQSIVTLCAWEWLFVLVWDELIITNSKIL